MTPEERRLVIELFDRLATLEDAQRDPEAERLVKDGLRQAPNAPYALVQTVLVQDEALRRANARIRELEGGAEAPPRDTSFLGSMRDTLLGSREARGSVPSVRPGSGPGASPTMSPAWRVGTPSGSAEVPPMQTGPAAAYGAPMGAGGSFLGTAASTAAADSKLDRDLKDRERELILATLRVTGGSRKLTAERLGISPRTLRHKLQQFKAEGVTVPRVHEQQFMTV